MDRLRLGKQLGMFAKQVYQQFMRYEEKKRLVFIVGCQRSGTRMLQKTFQRDFRAKVYGENGLARGWGRGTRLRLLPYDQIAQIITKENASLLIVRSLVESQNILRLLDFFPGSKAIWVYRYFRDVTNSSIYKFGPEPTKFNLQAIIDPDLNDHWYAENVSKNTREIVAKHFTEDRSISDLKSLAWYARNVLFFEQELDKNPRVFLCKYEDMIAKPNKVMKDLYSFLEYKYPGSYIVKHIHNRSVGKGKHIKISDDIAAICTNLLQKMDEISALSQHPQIEDLTLSG